MKLNSLKGVILQNSTRVQHMALNMFGKNLAHEEQGGHRGRPTSTDTPSPQKAHHGATEGRPDITIEIPWCPAHEGVPENEKADE